MAKFYAELPFDYSNLDLHRLIANQTDFVFANDVYETYNGIVYQDIASFEHYSGRFVLTTFAGTNFASTPDYATVTGGTVTGVLEQNWDGSNWLPGWWIEGISYSAVALANAAYTTGVADDYSAIQSVLAGNDQISLSSSSDRMRGYGGNDTLNGYGGNDTLYGDAGNDSLDGGTGADQLFGGSGNDVYRVDNLGDRVFETASATASVDLGGTDTVYSTVGLTLPSFVERLVLTGSHAVDGTGNSLGNRVTGNAIGNRLKGMGGNDTLQGGGGNDTLTGGSGTDHLSGGTGADLFDFNSVSETGTTSSTRDVITDFVRGSAGTAIDRIDLATIDANPLTPGTNDAFRFIGTASFSATDATGQLRYAYNATGNYGVLYGSTDADASPEFSIQLNGISSLAARDLIL